MAFCIIVNALKCRLRTTVWFNSTHSNISERSAAGRRPQVSFSEVCFCHGWAWGINCSMLHQTRLLASFLSFHFFNTERSAAALFRVKFMSRLTDTCMTCTHFACLFQEGTKRLLRPWAGPPLVMSQAGSRPQSARSSPRLWTPPVNQHACPVSHHHQDPLRTA